MEQMKNNFKSSAGMFAIAGTLSMIIGAVLWGSTGTDLWATLATNDMKNYLNKLPEAKTFLVLNTCFWVLGVLLMGIAIQLMSKLSRENIIPATLARVVVNAAVPVAIVSFVLMVSLAITISPDNIQNSLLFATNIGWIGARLDDIATLSIIGFAPLFLSISGHNIWIPAWLRVWGFFAGLMGLLAIYGILVPDAYFLSFTILPVGLGWMIASGVVLIKSKD